MRAVFRVDASAQIGSGHLMRCLTLAGQLRKMGADVVGFISRELEGNMFSCVEQQGYRQLVLPRHDVEQKMDGCAAWLTVPQKLDAEETISLLRLRGNVDWLIVDSYAIDIQWEDMVRSYVRHIMAIDDLANRSHNVELILDQNFSLEREKDYKDLVPGGCFMAMGLDYLLLRDEFYEAQKLLKKRDGRIHRVIVFFGGSDPTDETSKTLDAMECFPEFSVDVVVGGSNPNAGKIVDRCCLHENWSCHYQIDYIASLMAMADLAIGAGGSTTWERCYLGLPSLVISVADNQSGGAEFYDAQGIWKYLGASWSVNVADIVQAVKDIQTDSSAYRKMQDTAHRLFKNHSQGNVASIIMGRTT